MYRTNNPCPLGVNILTGETDNSGKYVKHRVCQIVKSAKERIQQFGKGMERRQGWKWRGGIYFEAVDRERATKKASSPKSVRKQAMWMLR